MIFNLQMKLVLLLGICLANDFCLTDDQYSELVRKLKIHQGRSGSFAKMAANNCAKYLVSNNECHDNETLEQHKSKQPTNAAFSKDAGISSDLRDQFKRTADYCSKLIKEIESHYCISSQPKWKYQANIEYWKGYTSNDRMLKDGQVIFID